MVDGDEVPGGCLAGGLTDRAVFTVDRQQLAALLTHVDAVVLTFDAAGVVTFISNSVRELLGFEPSELIGRSAFDFVHADDVARLISNLGRWVGRDGAVKGANVRARTSSGEWREVGFETVTGSAIEPFGAGVATMRAVRESTSIEQELRRRLVNEDRLTRLVRTFMADDADFETCVRSALDLMGSLESVDTIGIWRVQDGFVHQRFHWTAPTIPATVGEYRSFRVDEVEFTRALARLEEVALRVPDDSGGEDRHETQEMARHGTRRFFAVPMVTDTEFSGFVSFSSYRDENIFAPTHRSTLRAAAGIFAEAFARHETQGKLHYQARHDSLTGLANRWAFASAVEDGLRAIASGASAGMAALLFDLDRFHVINDSLGHAVGDLLLIALAERLSADIRESEVLARLGGDELVVLLTDVDSAHRAVERAEALVGALADPFVIGASELRVTASVGVSLICGQGDRSQLLREADAAMYSAKRAGGRQVRLFDDPLREEMVTRVDREHDLSGALARDELLLHYQPEFDLRTGKVVAVEALVRWQHPRDGLLEAGGFVGIAEDSGMIVDIGLWVIERAFHQIACWAASGNAAFTMRINLSARQIAQSDVVTRARELARRAGVDPARVCFELTETAVMIDPAGALAVLEGLRAEGFSIAIDDFGTGYSSLAYLREFPVDLLKIDRSFVSRLGATAADSSLVRAIIAMADTLELPVTAEGIETLDQLEALVGLGCTHGQGYLLARPAAPDHIASLLGVTPRT